MRHSLANLAPLLGGGGEKVWFEIIPCEQWQGARSNAAIEVSRRRINMSLQKFTTHQGFGFIRHRLLSRQVNSNFGADGVHLSDSGSEVFLLNIRGALDRMGCT